MGLDNGIQIRGKNKEAEEFLQRYFSELEITEGSKHYELVYFRKAWNIRERTLAILGNKYDSNEHIIKMKFKHLRKFRDEVLKYFLDENYWNYGGRSSLFSWTDCIPHIGYGIKNITDFLDFAEEYELKNKDFEIVWYDSY